MALPEFLAAQRAVALGSQRVASRAAGAEHSGRPGRLRFCVDAVPHRPGLERLRGDETGARKYEEEDDEGLEPYTSRHARKL